MNNSHFPQPITIKSLHFTARIPHYQLDPLFVFVGFRHSPLLSGNQQYDVVAGYNVFTPIFENTTSTAEGVNKLDLQNLKLIGAADGETLQVVSTGGKFIETYYWFNAFGDYPEGWCRDQEGFEMAEGEYLEKGEAFYLNLKGDAKLQTSGTVKLGTFERPLYAGYNMVGNATPYTIDLQNVKLVSATDGDTLQVLNAAGKFVGTYYWFNAFGDYPEGWCHDQEGFEMVEVGTLPFGSGNGAYINVRSNCSYKINP